MTTTTSPIRVEQLFAAAAQGYPERIALLYGARTWTYAARVAESRRRAHVLHAAGLPPGTTVIAIEPMSDDLVFALLACCSLGLVFCHLSTQYTAREIIPLAKRANGQLVLTRDGTPHPFLPTLPALPLDLIGGDAVTGAIPPRNEAGETALLGTTSGTTAQLPKLAITSHRSLTWRRGLVVGLEGRPGVTATTTQSFKSLVRQLCVTVGEGSTLLITSTLTPAKLERELERAQVAYLLTQPAILKLLVDNPRPLPDALQIAVIRVGAATLSPELAQAATRRYGARTIRGFSSTECGLMAVEPEEGAPIGTIGRPCPGVTIRLVDATGSDVPIGVQGEIIVQSPGLMEGYLGDPDATAAVLRDGWYWTGDLATCDAAGYYFLQGRRSLLINVGGLKVAPEEVEAVLLTYPGVREAVVLGQPDERRGERIRAIICLVGEAPTTATLRRFCLERLAPYKIPQTWEYRDTLPRSPLGKVLRHQL